MDRDLNGKALAKRLRGTGEGGIPWIVITDAAGKQLVTSDGPRGNVGCPVTDEEQAWFLTMIERTAKRLGPDGMQELTGLLSDYAEGLK